MRRGALRIAAILIVLLAVSGTPFEAVAQLDLSKLRAPVEQPGPGAPFIELDATVGLENWQRFLSALAQATAADGFVAYPYLKDPLIRHFVGMALWHDELFVNLYNNKKEPGTFVVGLFHTNLKADAGAAPAQFLAKLKSTVAGIPGATLGENHANPAAATKSAPRPPLRLAEITVPAANVDDAVKTIRRFAERGGFFVDDAAIDHGGGLRRIALWRTDLKIVFETPAEANRFIVTFLSHLPLPSYPPGEVEDFLTLCIQELGKEVAKIPGGRLRVTS